MTISPHAKGRGHPRSRPLRAPIASLLAVILNTSAIADDFRWRKVADVDAVVIVAREVTRAELTRAARQYGERIGSHQREGFSVLRRKADGSFVCDVWVISLADEQARAHAQRTCEGWSSSPDGRAHTYTMRHKADGAYTCTPSDKVMAHETRHCTGESH